MVETVQVRFEATTGGLQTWIILTRWETDVLTSVVIIDSWTVIN